MKHPNVSRGRKRTSLSNAVNVCVYIVVVVLSFKILADVSSRSKQTKHQRRMKVTYPQLLVTRTSAFENAIGLLNGRQGFLSKVESWRHGIVSDALSSVLLASRGQSSQTVSEQLANVVTDGSQTVGDGGGPLLGRLVIGALSSLGTRKDHLQAQMNAVNDFDAHAELSRRLKSNIRGTHPAVGKHQDATSMSASARFRRSPSTLSDLSTAVTSSLNAIRNVNVGEDYFGGAGADPRKAFKVGILQQSMREEATFACNSADKIPYQLSNFESIRHVRKSTNSDESWYPQPLPPFVAEKAPRQISMLRAGATVNEEPDAPYTNCLIAMCTVSRSRTNYVYNTIQSLLHAMTPVEKAGVRIVVYNADHPYPQGHGDIQRIQLEYSSEIESGLITIVTRDDISVALGGAGSALGIEAERQQRVADGRLSIEVVEETLNAVSAASELTDIELWSSTPKTSRQHTTPADTKNEALSAVLVGKPVSLIQERLERTGDSQYLLLDKAKSAMVGSEHNGNAKEAESTIYASKLSRRWGDDAKRTFWRSKQALDMAMLLEYVSRETHETLGGGGARHQVASPFASFPFVLMLEDDIKASKGFAYTLRQWVDTVLLSKGNTDWTVASFYNPWPDVSDGEKLPPFKFFGVIGQLVRMSDVPNIAMFLRKNFDQSPLDWLFVDFLKKFNGSMVVHTPSLFQHVGVESSLDGKDQPANAADFAG